RHRAEDTGVARHLPPPANHQLGVLAGYARGAVLRGDRPAGRPFAPALRRHDDDTVRGVLAVQGRRRGTLYDFDPLDRVRIDVVQRRWRGIVVFVAADEPLACMTCQVAAALTRLVGVHADAVDYDDRIVAEQCAAVATQPDTRGVTRRAGTPLHNEARYPALEKVGHARDRFRGHDRVRIDHCDVVA